MKKSSSLEVIFPSSGCNSKREKRLERKKRKLIALAEVMQLNENVANSSNNCTPTAPQQISQLPVADESNQEPEQKKLRLEDVDYTTLKAEVNKKRDRMRNVPGVRLKEVGTDALMKTKLDERVPLLMDDIQALLMHVLLRSDSPMCPSRWAVVDKSTKITHTTVLLVEGLTSEDFTENEREFKECKKMFHNILQVVAPCDRLVEEIACVPLSETHKDILLAEYGSLEAALLARKDHLLIRKSIFNNIYYDENSKDGPDYSKDDLPVGDKFPRTQLLLSPIQMINEDYPLPLSGNLRHRYSGYINTCDRYTPVTPKSPMFGLDCEMCKTKVGSEVTRVSIVDEQGNEFYETLVRPPNKIIDYLTQFSGITPELMKDVSTTLTDVHRDLKNKLPSDAILVGQSLNFDLVALKMMHPYVIDTSILFNVTGTQGAKTKLKVLTKKFLNRDIQCSTGGHNSIEDCTASLELVKLKLSKDIYYGDQWLQDRRSSHIKRAKSSGIATPEEVQRISAMDPKATEITTTLFSHVRKKNKKSAIVTNGDNLGNFESYFGDAIKSNSETKHLLSFERLDSDEAVIERTREQCLTYDFNLSCIQLKRNEMSDNDLKRAKIAQIDGWIRKVFESISVNGLLVVLLAGGEVAYSSRMAVAMIQTKKAKCN